MPHNGKTRLRNLDFDEVSLVSSGDDPKALVVISKAQPEGKDLHTPGDTMRKKKKAKLGSGARFRELSASLRSQGVRDPDALAAWIGRKKYGAKKFGRLGSKKVSKSPHDGDGDGKYSIHPGAPDVTPVPKFPGGATRRFVQVENIGRKDRQAVRQAAVRRAQRNAARRRRPMPPPDLIEDRQKVMLPLVKPLPPPPPTQGARNAVTRAWLKEQKGKPKVSSGGPPPGVKIIPNKPAKPKRKR